jgi:hypothetical protein
LALSTSIRHMPPRSFSTIWLGIGLLPLMAWGQLQTPAERAEVVLRGRVTEFLQYHVEGNFRKAFDFVADDTKDDYFNSSKVQLKGFTIDKIVFADDFTKATVTAMISKTMMIVGQEFPVTTPSISTWKIENGKWVWYNDPKAAWGTPLDPLGASKPVAAVAQSANPQNNDTGGDLLPKNFDEKAIAAAALNILQQVSMDKKEVTLANNKPSEEKVIFHNGMSGSLQLELSAPEIPGFTAKAEQANVPGGGDVPLVFRYDPGDAGGRRDPITVRLVVQPVNQSYTIQVNFAAVVP